MNLRTKILAITLGMSIATVAAMVVIVIFFIKPRLESKLEKRGESIAHAISTQCINPILSRNFFQLDMLFREFIRTENGVEYIFVLAPNGEISAHSFGREFPVALKGVKPIVEEDGHGMARIFAADREIIDISMPLLNESLGVLHVGMSAQSLTNDVNEIIGSLTAIALLFLSSSVLILIFLERWVIRPIFEIKKASVSVGEGDLDRRVEVSSSDEIGRLADEFNKMLDSIKQSRATLINEKLLLANSEERFRTIIEQSPISMALVSMDGTIDYINNYAVETFGYLPEEIPHMNDWWLKAYPDGAYRDKVKAQWAGHLEKAIAEDRFIDRDEYLVTCKDGTIKAVMIFGVLVSGKVFVIFEDITDRNRAINSLRESETRYQIFTSITSDYVYKCSRRGGEPFHVDWMAGATEQITGYSVAELMQMTCWLHIIHPDDKERVGRFLTGLAPGDKSATEFRIITKGGDIRWIHECSYCESGKEPDEFIHYGSSQDITSSKLVEDEIHRLNSELEDLVDKRTVELTRSNRDLASFCYAISHELRAPVARLQGLSQALQEDWAENPAEAEYCVKRIEVASNELQRVINSVLQLSRLSQVSFELQPLNLSILVKEITDSLVSENSERNIEVIIADDITASGDPSLVRLFLENLLGNAVKYTAHEPLARIEFGLDEVSGACFVRDNGIGFDMSHAKKLFEPFTRLHKEDEFAGSGIGLATVQRIIERHGGKIWAESTPGAGSVFYFKLSVPSGDRYDA